MTLCIKRKARIKHIQLKENKLLQNNIFLIFTVLLYLTYLIFIELKYFSLNTAYLDLGAFDTNIWKISSGDLVWAFAGHFHPVQMLYAVIYKVISGGWLLIFLQWLCVGIGALLLYGYTKRALNIRYAVLVVFLFVLNPCVINNIYFDFHTDHLIIPLMMIFYTYLEGKKYLLPKDKLILAVLTGAMMLIKEPLILAASMLGLVIFFKTKNKPFGISLFLFGIGFFLYCYHSNNPRGKCNSRLEFREICKRPFFVFGE